MGHDNERRQPRPSSGVGMKLSRVSVTHYRSLFCDANRTSAIDAGLGAGISAFVAPNNYGRQRIQLRLPRRQHGSRTRTTRHFQSVLRMVQSSPTIGHVVTRSSSVRWTSLRTRT